MRDGRFLRLLLRKRVMIITFSINEKGVEQQAIVKFSLILSSFHNNLFRTSDYRYKAVYE